MFLSTLSTKYVAPALGAFALFGVTCSASAAVDNGVAAPQFAVGDHWQYRVTDNLRRGAVSQLDVEVIAVMGHTARIRLDRTDTSGRTEWIDELDGEGSLTSGSLNREPARPFDPPAKLLVFPLDKGKIWRQTINTLRKDTGIKDQILIYDFEDKLKRCKGSVPALKSARGVNR